MAKRLRGVIGQLKRESAPQQVAVGPVVIRSQWTGPVLIAFGAALLLALGYHEGKTAGTALFLVVVLIGYRQFGYGGLLAVAVVAIAAGSSSIPAVRSAGGFVRWEALLLLAIVPLFERHRFRITLPGATGPAAALVLWCLLTAGWSSDPSLTVVRTIAFALILWIGLVAAPQALQSEPERRRALAALLVVVLVSSLVSLVIGVVSPSEGRLQGAFEGWLQNSNTLGLWTAALAPSVLVLRHRFWRSALSLGLLVVVILSQSRSAFVVLLFYVVVYFAPHRAALRTRLASALRRRRVVIGLVVGLIGLVAAGVAGDHFLVQHTAVEKLVNRRGSLIVRISGGRSEAWSDGVRAAAQSPIGGFGFGTAETDFQLLGFDQRFTYFIGDEPSDSYLRMLLEDGVVGLALLAVLLAVLCSAASDSRADLTRLPFALLGGGILIAALVESLLTSAGGPFGILAWVGLGTAAYGKTAPLRFPWSSLTRARMAIASQRKALAPLAMFAPLILGLLLVGRLSYSEIFHPRETPRNSIDGILTASQRHSVEEADHIIPPGQRYYLFVEPQPVYPSASGSAGDSSSSSSSSSSALTYQYVPSPNHVTNATSLYLPDKLPVNEPSAARWLLAWGSPDAAAGLSVQRAYNLGNGFYLYHLVRAPAPSPRAPAPSPLALGSVSP